VKRSSLPTTTIKAEETSEDPSISAETATEATTVTHDQFSAGGTSGDIESLMIPLGAPLLELLKPPDFLLKNLRTTSYNSSFSIPAGERDTMKIKYWLDVYQLLSMRQLICRATYTGGVQYAYTCAHEECSGCLTMRHSSSDGRLRAHGYFPQGLIDQDQELYTFEHTCSPHCQWGTASSLLSEFKPQGFVLSPALRFAIVAQFLYQQERDDLFLEKQMSVDENISEDLRLQMNSKLGLEVTQGQWKETLQSFCRLFLSRRIDRHDVLVLDRIFLSGRIDRRDVKELAPLHFWMLYNGYKEVGSPFWFHTKVRDTDTACVWWLKRIYLWTAFPVLTILQYLFLGIFILLVCVSALLYLPCLCYSGHRRQSAAKEGAARYDRDGVEVPGYVSNRWVVQNEGNPIYLIFLTFFEKDGTMIIKQFRENPLRPYEEETVPVLVLPDTPGSGIPKRMTECGFDHFQFGDMKTWTEQVSSY
jgi:hypothetical protein